MASSIKYKLDEDGALHFKMQVYILLITKYITVAFRVVVLNQIL